MKIVLQRVLNASVTVDNNVIGAIDKGLLIFLGIEADDTEDMLQKYADKIIKLRIFEDENGKTTLGLKEVGGSLLLISQFTLYADCKGGNRPSFIKAGAPDMASEMYEYIIKKCKEEIDIVEQGEFGADMKVELLNDGPFTILLDSDSL